MRRKVTIGLGAVTAVILISIFTIPFARVEATTIKKNLKGLQHQATVVRDKYGVPHVTALNDHDVYFMMGYLHAQDRFFQMDVSRRLGSGTLAELLGAGPGDQILGSDVQMRFFGLRRVAARSLNAYSPQIVALIQAYADGVNAWLDSNTLPPEYNALEITRASKWKPIDSITVNKLIQFQNSFSFSDVDETGILMSYQTAGRVASFDGVKLFFEDIFRYSPFDPTITGRFPAGEAPLSSQRYLTSELHSSMAKSVSQALDSINPAVIEIMSEMVKQHKENPLLNRDRLGTGSNWWIVAGSKTNTGNAILANDPHLELGVPATFYEIHLMVNKGSTPMNVYGVSFAGTPGVFLGQNEKISWGASTSSVDVTDFYSERLVIEGGMPIATRYKDKTEPLVIFPEEFKANQISNGNTDDLVVISPGRRQSGLGVFPTTFFSTRRNYGPVIQVSPTDGVSVQSTLSSATVELEGIFALARARNISDFRRGLQFLEAGSFNWAYADVGGNIATFINGKVPLREDLQSGTVEGLPPFFLRDGTGTIRNEWIPKSNNDVGVSYESVPFEEMPQAINPSQGFLVNANNDPIGVTLDNDPLNQVRGEGIYYISSKFSSGLRAAKITSLLEQELSKNDNYGKLSLQDMKRIQGNVQLRDAEVFTPYIIQAFNNAQRPGAPSGLAVLASDPGVQEAIGRLMNWDFSAPTGISQGYDGDRSSQKPFDHKESDSIAATIYTVWRREVLLNTIGATLQRVGLAGALPGDDRMLVALRFLLDNFATKQGVGASSLDFFRISGVDAPAEIRRDAIILSSLRNALSQLSSERFAEAFGGSTNQTDYQWGKLHRITFNHAFRGLAPQFSVPTAGNFKNLSPQLPGLAVDGGYETIDNAPIRILSTSSQGFTFGGGPARRYIGELRRAGITSAQVIPGGQSGVVGDRHHSDQLQLWLTNEYHNVFFSLFEILSNQESIIIYRPTS